MRPRAKVARPVAAGLGQQFLSPNLLPKLSCCSRSQMRPQTPSREALARQPGLVNGGSK